MLRTSVLGPNPGAPFCDSAGHVTLDVRPHRTKATRHHRSKMYAFTLGALRFVLVLSVYGIGALWADGEVGIRAAVAQTPAADDVLILKPKFFADAATSIALPDYPEEARREGDGGLVLLGVTVDEKGAVTALERVRGFEPFVSAAERAARLWRFAPFVKDGTPRKVRSVIGFEFFVGKGTVAVQGPGGIYTGTPGLVFAVRASGTPDLPDGVTYTPNRELVAERAPLTVGVLEGRAVVRVQPEYPSDAILARISGTVVVEARVDETGTVESVRTLEGPPLLRLAAENAARQWRFTPKLVRGVPVKVVGTITFTFRRR